LWGREDVDAGKKCAADVKKLVRMDILCLFDSSR